MKHLASLALLLPLAGCTLSGQVASPEAYPYSAPAYPPAATVPPMPALFTAEQLDQLLGPIALYPDALLALMLPASTNPSDIVLAARYLQAGGNPDQVDDQPWDDSVRGLAHYPQVVRWMDENLVWTKQLGQAFATQSADVMNAVQRLRSRAQAAGNLINTPQQQVVYEGGTIMIVPTQPDVIYVPYYDPTVVYVPYGTSYYSPSFYGFSSGFAAGWWLSYGLDWGHHRVWTIDRGERERYWRDHRYDWHRPSSYVHVERSPGFRSWEPHGPRAPQHASPTRPSYVTQPTPHERSFDQHRDDRRNGPDRDRNAPDRDRNASAPSPAPNFVGPTALRSPLPQPLPTPSPVPAMRQVNPPAPSSHRYDRPANQGGRNDRSPANAAPSSPAPVVGPMPMAQGHPYSAPVQAAPAPRPAPSMPRYTPSAPPAPAPAPPLQRYTPPPAPAPQAQQAPAPAPQQSQSSSNDDDRRRPPFVRPMR